MEISIKKTAQTYKVIECFEDWRGKWLQSQPMAVFESKEQAGEFLETKGYSRDVDGNYVLPQTKTDVRYSRPFAVIEECSPREAKLILEANKIAQENSKSQPLYGSGGVNRGRSEEPLTINIWEVTIPSAGEALMAGKKIPGILRKTNCNFWLRDPGKNPTEAMYISNDGYSGSCDITHELGIRPLIRMTIPEGVSLEAGEKLSINGRDWTVISMNMALCDDIVAVTAFRNVRYDITERVYIARDGSAVPDSMLSEFEGSDANVAVDQFAIDSSLIHSFPFQEPEYAPET